MRRQSFAALVAVAVLASSSQAFAEGETSAPVASPGVGSIDAPGGFNDRSPHDRKSGLSVWAFLPYSFGIGIGVGARYTLPLLKDGFIDQINDSVELEFGGDVGFGGYFGYSYVLVDIPVEARWTFHVTPQVDLYGKLGLGVDLWFSSYSGVGGPNTVGFLAAGALGGIYKFSDAFAFRLELGYPGLKAGVAFAF